ncbi:MAG TPA: peptidylprolyl isomerase [Niastella sp.]
MKLSFKPVLLVCMAACGCFCNEPKDQKTPVNGVDEEIIFSVGNWQLTNYELKKNFEFFKKNTAAANKRPVTEPEVKKWVDDYTMRSYFLADAEAKGFYQRNDLVNAVEAIESFILSQSNGPLEQHLLKDITPAFIKAEIEKSKKSLNLNERQMALKLKRELLERYYHRIRMRSGVTFNQALLQEVGDILQRSGPVHMLAKSEFQGMLNNDIVQFVSAEGKKNHVSLEQFIDYYNALSVQQYLVNTGSVIAYLYKISYASYIRMDAARLGITNDPKFRLDKKNYMNNLVYRKYEEDFLTDTAFISPSEIEQTYDWIKSRFVLPTEVQFSMFTFKNLRVAFQSKMTWQKLGSDTTKLPYVVKEKRHLTMDYTSKILPDSLKQHLFAMELSQVSQPVLVKGMHTLLVKERETGKRQQALDEVKEVVIQEIRIQRLEVNKQERYKQLSKLYQKKGAVDYRKLI